MSKTVNFMAAASAASIGDNTVARVRVVDGATQIRFTKRVNRSNLPKGEALANVRVKGSGRRATLPAAFADSLEIGSRVQLIPGKYGWNTLAPMSDGATAAASISS